MLGNLIISISNKLLIVSSLNFSINRWFFIFYIFYVKIVPVIYSYEEYAHLILVYGYCNGTKTISIRDINDDIQTAVFQTSKRSVEASQLSD